MTRKCSTCQHIKRAEIDRRLAAGEPGNQIARDYHLNPLKPAPPSGQLPQPPLIQCDHEGGCARHRGGGLSAVEGRIEQRLFRIAGADRPDRRQAQQQGSLAVAISGLNSIRHTLDSLTRLAGYDRPGGPQVNVAIQNNLTLDLTRLARAIDPAFRS